MCEHSELVAEMPVLEKMSTQERLKLARKRRMQQLKKWNLREKDYNYKKKNNETFGKRSGGNVGVTGGGKRDYKVHFVPSVMLLEAAARNDVEEVRRLLMLGVSPDSTNEDGLTALHQCCIDDSEEMMKILIEFGGNINAQDSEQWTPLHAAATCGLLHLVRYLISKGADLLAVNADGNMPYDICEDEATLDYIESEMAKRGITQEMIDETRASVENRMLADLKKVAESGGDLEFRDVHGATPLHIAAANGYSVVVEFLLDNHVSTDVVDNDLWQPIHAAACWGHPDVLEQLVQAGADLNARTKNGETPLEICEDPESKSKIIDLMGKIECKNSTHYTKSKKCHLQNTRCQKILRTKLTQKSHISRREAQEEFKLLASSFQSGDENEPTDQNHTNNQNNSIVSPVDTIIHNEVNEICLKVKENLSDIGIVNHDTGIDDTKKLRTEQNHRKSLSPIESPKTSNNDRDQTISSRSLRNSNSSSSTTRHTKVSDNMRDYNYPEDSEDSKLSHVLEIYDFPSDIRTQDLVTSLAVFNLRDFDIKWVDDSHALAVFSSQAAAKEAMSMPHHNIRLRPLNEGIKESKVKAQKCADNLLPYKQRPQTSAILARRLITGALGIRSSISSEQRAAEKKRLQEAKVKMCEHSELVAEMPVLEKMSTQERLKLARKRRMQQLKKWNLREKDYNYKKKNNETFGKRSGGNVGVTGGGKRDYKVHFVPSVMLLEAAARNDVEEVRRLLMLGVSPDSTNEDGLTALHQCCIDDSEEMMKILIEFGGNINAQDSEQWTPLHAAATCGLLHLVRYLISKGADLLAVNADGNMPYDICEDEATLDYIESEMAKRGITQEMIDETRASVENRMLADLKKVAESGGDLEFRDVHGATPLHIAAANGYSVVVEFLLDNHVSTDVVDNDLWQPIHAAACWGHPDVLEQLVQAGADLNARTKNGETPLEICEDPELKERIIELRNEMETKKASHSLRLKRSHSQNTRSQSVRRTSIREKSQISRREAREEARLRVESSQNGEDDEDQTQRNNLTNNHNNFAKNLTNSSSTIISNSNDKDEPIVINKVNGFSSPVKGSVSASGHVNNDLINSSSLLPSYGDSLITPEPNKQSSNHQFIESNVVPKQIPSSSSSDYQINLRPLSKDAVVIRNDGYCEKDSIGTESVTNSINDFNSDFDYSRDDQSVIDGIPSGTTSDSLSCRSGYNNNNLINRAIEESSGRSVRQLATSKSNNRNSISSGSSSTTTGNTSNNMLSNESVKVEIHVTVNANPPNNNFGTGTLADLKKHRADLRHRNSLSPGESPKTSNNERDQTIGTRSLRNSNSSSSTTTTTTTNARHLKASYSFQSPPSPSGDLKKFRADPSEVVGEIQNKGCCKLM
ncbi:uncharacterized protein LOC128386259 [Panonychus citri]|uniref:uncharacterized protein LOC128386259 n=1 Tax=Panonychus citri TaxID=50023 RepID=UPI0023075C68|nr:uncharacterized protein LOC128386259 [Panonychus citri]